MVWLGGWLTGPPWSFGRRLCAWRHFNRRDPTSSWRNWRSRKDVDAGKIEQTEKAPGRHEEPEHAGSELTDQPLGGPTEPWRSTSIERDPPKNCSEPHQPAVGCSTGVKPLASALTDVGGVSTSTTSVTVRTSGRVQPPKE